MAKIEPEFTKRNAKLIGLSVDPAGSHSRWLSDIEETQDAKVGLIRSRGIARQLPQTRDQSGPLLRAVF